MSSLEPPPPQDIVIIGATGDLARRRLLPALYNLCLDGLLPERGSIIGYGRSPLDEGAFRQLATAAVDKYSRRPLEAAAWQAFASRLTFVSGADGGIEELRRRSWQPDRLVYLATPASAFGPLAQELASHHLIAGTRLVVEKPFGFDLATAIALRETLHEHFAESQLFRIDHYLGKETVQNILVFRFANWLFERSWNREAIDSVQLTVAESDGMEGRGAFYEETGALRDIVQNHVMQVLTLLTMEPPVSIDPRAIHDEKAKVLQAIHPIDPRDVVRGQYAMGELGSVTVPGYGQEEGVRPDSETETFVALKLGIDNWRWRGVPFFVRAGKRMPRRVTEVQVVFHPAPLTFFQGTSVSELPVNHLTLRIQPDERISFNFLAKTPGSDVLVEPVRMQFPYTDFRSQQQEAYERLLLAAMEGDQTLFLREDAIELAWKALQPILDQPPALSTYPAGTWGPPEADALVAPRAWHLH